MIISAYGFILLFASNQAMMLVSAPYLPSVLVTISFLGISSYLLLLGIYSSAESMSHDTQLQRSIKKSAKAYSQFLGRIGTTEKEHQIQKVVLQLTKEYADQMTQETGFETSVTEEDMQEYLIMVKRNKHSKE